MQHIRMALMAGVVAFTGLTQAEVRVEGPVEYGIFTSEYQDFEAGERVLARSNQDIQRTDRIPAKLGTKFGLRYSLAGKREGDTPLTLLYLTPGVITSDGQRHDKFEVQQKLTVGAVQDVMAFEFSEHHEAVPGEWHFMVFQGDRKLAEQRFLVR